jgi:hypothetical protein
MPPTKSRNQKTVDALKESPPDDNPIFYQWEIEEEKRRLKLKERCKNRPGSFR